MRSGYSKFLTIFLIIIIVAVIGLLAYLGIDAYSKHRINKEAEEFVDASIDAPTVDVPTGNSAPSNFAAQPNDNNQPENLSTTTDDSTTTESTSVAARRPTYKGFYTVGSIQIPKTNVKYPVLENATARAIEVAVGVEVPQPNPVLNTVGNIVIAGHNYRNGMFFSNNKKLSKGDKIYITDLNNKKVTYVIYKIFETTDSDASFYFRDTKGKREITLKTCTDDGTKRLIIQAREEE